MTVNDVLWILGIVLLVLGGLTFTRGKPVGLPGAAWVTFGAGDLVLAWQLPVLLA